MIPSTPQKRVGRARIRSGGAAGPVLLIVAAMAISAAVFFLYTKKKMDGGASAEASVVTAEKSDPATPEPEMKAPAEPVPPPVPKTVPVAPPSFGFARPVDLGKQMADLLASGDFEGAGQLAAAGSPEMAGQAAEVFRKAIEDMGFKPGREDQVELLGMLGTQTRLSLPLKTPDGKEVRLQLDVERDTKMGWKIGKLQLPQELAAAMATPPVPAAPPSGAEKAPAEGGKGSPAVAMTEAAGKSVPGSTRPAVVDGKEAAMKAPAASKPALQGLFSVGEPEDALTFASDFVKQLLDHDFEAAMKDVDPVKVPAERLAGLCIVFEEGQYRMKESKPLVITVANPQVSWVIAQVESEELGQSTEFGLELSREGAGGEWQVVGMNLSDILGSFAKAASKLGVPYTPVVKNPKGGESLALYFEYDSANLHERAMKQLEIVAGILKSDPSKHLLITGHTDALGSDSYNMALSDRRAESVKLKLVEMGVPFGQVETKGFGKAQPLGPNQLADGSDNPEGRGQNRRAEIYLDF